MKKYIILVLLCVLLTFTTSCGGNPDSDLTKSIPDLSGQWKQVNSNSKEQYQGAIIEGNKIEIYWVSNNGDTRSLYWSGSFLPPTTEDEPYSWTSSNNKEKTEEAILASRDDTKTFSYEDRQISYSSSVMGTTTTIRLEKSEWAPGLKIGEVAKQEEPIYQKRNSSGFHVETNQKITFAGIDFSLPDYYDAPDEKSTETYKHYYPERNDCSCSLIFQSEDAKFSVSDFDRNKEKAAMDMISKLSSGNASEIQSSPRQIANLSGWSFSFKNGKNSATVNGAFAFDPDSQRLILLVQMYDDTDRSNIDYTGDFDKIIESAKRESTSTPTENIAPEPSLPEEPEFNQGATPGAESPSEALVDGMRPDFKAAMDSYETFFEYYCEFMENYDTSNLSMLTEYAKVMSQYADIAKKFEQWEDGDLNDTELAYYLQIQARVNEKLLSIASP